MISVRLASRLRAAGLAWRPRQFDFFHIPDRDLDERVFVIADLSADVQPLADGIAAITFNGAVEWSLDYILQQDVVWLPTEAQIRARLGEALQALERTEGEYVCVISHEGVTERYPATSASDAYGEALLALLARGASLADIDRGPADPSPRSVH
jgi:hypothetical protein